jgi:hypothetical protein
MSHHKVPCSRGPQRSCYRRRLFIKLYFAAFKYLITTISNEALKMIEEEWYKLKTRIVLTHAR